MDGGERLKTRGVAKGLETRRRDYNQAKVAAKRAIFKAKNV